MRYCVLCSSSSGNCTYLEINNNVYLLDAGISYKQVVEKLGSIGITLKSLKGIFITHEHSDHVSGLSSIASKTDCKIYMSKGTYRGLNDNLKEKVSPLRFVFLKPDDEYELIDFTLKTIKLSHDALDPIGYSFIDSNQKELVYITDTGTLIPNDNIKNKDAYIIESNHEPDLLLLSNRPWILKNRIMSNSGHLSNQSSARLFSSVYGNNTKSVMLFHLSNECNNKELALLSYNTILSENGIDTSLIDIVVSDRKEPTKIMEV